MVGRGMQASGSPESGAGTGGRRRRIGPDSAPGFRPPGLVDRSGTDAEQQGPDQDADHDPWLPHAREHRVVWVNPTYPVAGLPQPGRTLVVGVVNVTPDSFSDGGKWFDPDAAVAHGLDLLEQGADIVDVGGESTRPGAVRPSLAEELRRVMPVVHGLVEAGAVVSVDTMRTAVVTEAVAAGAKLVNDVSGGQADPQMFATIGRLGVPYVCMHWRGHAADMQSRASYADVVSEVVAELRSQIDAALRAGIDPEQLILDPGVGFAKTGEHNWELLHRFDELSVLGRPAAGRGLTQAISRHLAGRRTGQPAATGGP